MTCTNDLGDFEAVTKIAQVVGNIENPPIICGLARALKKDISVCYDAIKHAKFPRIHTFVATSDIHMEVLFLYFGYSVLKFLFYF